MTPAQEKKQKVLALLTVVFLFLIVGTLLFNISVNNRNKNEIRKDEAIKRQLENENIKRFDYIHLDTSTSTLSASSTQQSLTSKAHLTMIATDGGKTKILAKKNSDLVLPIASVTKLMVAIITMENMNPETEVTATLDYIGQDESAFILETNKVYKVKDLLANALISSDNDSARLLSSILGTDNFIAKMNLKAQEIGLLHTKYVNVTGLDPKTPSQGINVSTVSDLANLILYIKNNFPNILKITTNLNYNFCDIDNYCKMVTSTDKLLDNKELKYKIIGGKTGSTDLALKNLVLMTELTNGISLINVVLGSEDNFADSLSLINKVLIEN